MLGATWWRDKTESRHYSQRLKQLARWLLFTSGILFGGSTFITGYISLEPVAVEGAFFMIVGVAIIEVALFAISPMKLSLEENKK